MKAGQYIIYRNGERYEIGKIKRVTEDGAFVYYSEGDTAAKTPFECMHPLTNEYVIKETSLGGEHIIQPEIIRCKDCKYWIPYDWMFSEVWRSNNMADYPEDEIGCNWCDMAMKADDYCSRAERREVTT